MRDFMGLNVHTVQFKPDLYAPVCRRLRDYHPLGWDIVGDDPSHLTKFPMAANGVDWGALRLVGEGGLRRGRVRDVRPGAAGEVEGPAREARAYGEAFARSFGPSGPRPIVSSVEIGNEPSKYDEAKYRTLFEAMARGVRGGPKAQNRNLCRLGRGQAGRVEQAAVGRRRAGRPLRRAEHPQLPVQGTLAHLAAVVPEDAGIPFLTDVIALLRWRDARAGKEVWVTEFGYDSATKPPAANGPWAKWVGVSDDEQARYIVRSFLALSATGVDRAYLYFFNDKEESATAPALRLCLGPSENHFALDTLPK